MYHKSRGLLKERQGCQQKEVWEEEKGRPGKETRKTIGQASQPERWMVKLRTTETRSSTLRFGGGARARTEAGWKLVAGGGRAENVELRRQGFVVVRLLRLRGSPEGSDGKARVGTIRRLLLDAAATAAADDAVSPRPEASGAPQSKLLTRDACWQPRDIVREDQVFALGASLARGRLPGWRRMDGQARSLAFIRLATMMSSSATYGAAHDEGRRSG
ncbi:hypothetical protein BN1723_015798 [Verticillium longisporum]|uniref:Uncharacterized protein n=1 Tax=Verticillium longisporum TaxID=100787 RepID=A0A0G4N2W8_VERLO|nr:hypothetical protein BN1723_015798 [Verticillium longisporum]